MTTPDFGQESCSRWAPNAHFMLLYSFQTGAASTLTNAFIFLLCSIGANNKVLIIWVDINGKLDFFSSRNWRRDKAGGCPIVARKRNVFEHVGHAENQRQNSRRSDTVIPAVAKMMNQPVFMNIVLTNSNFIQPTSPRIQAVYGL